MINYKDAQRADILADVKKDPEKIKWFKEFASQKKVDKNGKERKPTFFEAKRAYYEHFYPDQTPPAKKKQKSFFDEIMEL